MKILITYYSFTGNTKKVAQALEKFLKDRGNDVDIQRLLPENESRNFFIQAKQAFLKADVNLKPPVIFDLSGYDLIFVGSGVWAFSPVPAIRKYLKLIENCKDKKFFLFVTYGSGVGRFRCFKQMEQLIKNEQGKVIGRIDVSDKKVNDSDFLTKTFEEVIKL